MRKQLWINWFLATFAVVGFIVVGIAHLSHVWDNHSWSKILTLLACVAILIYLFRKHDIELFEEWLRISQSVTLLIVHGAIKRFVGIRAAIRNNLQATRHGKHKHRGNRK